ncbi:MAG TPA: ribosome biogenesis GTP-binding protein YihA/YsxC [Thermodesulfovibrionia bacterium]|nr:ribosome biogenesis GTP-binding protein YihA/YsxC [Thermodesulfovibrionia bacterium]
MHIIHRADFLYQAASEQEYPPACYPEIAFIGRSNVGKSSLINSILGRKELARISCTPGKTRALNFFKINDKFLFVDFPGYGYAKVSKRQRQSWKTLVEGYLKQRQVLRMVILLRDISIPDSPYDEQMKEWLLYYKLPLVEVYTKLDKLKSSERQKRLNTIDRSAPHRVFAVSAKTGEGLVELKKFIFASV